GGDGAGRGSRMAIPLPRRPGEERRAGPQRHEPTPEPAREPPKRIARAIAIAVALAIWFIPPPGRLTPQAWHLFAIFGATILSVVIGAFPILTASVLGIAAAVLSGTVTPDAAYDGLSNPAIVLIHRPVLAAPAA